MKDRKSSGRQEDAQKDRRKELNKTGHRKRKNGWMDRRMADGIDRREIGGRKLRRTRKTDGELWKIRKSKQERNGEEMDERLKGQGMILEENRRITIRKKR